MITFDRDNLPETGWTTWRKLVPTDMVRIQGPFTAVTSDGPAFCEDGWLAIDARGYPYPIDAGEQAIIYEQVLDLDDHPELAESIRAAQADRSNARPSSSRRPRLSREAREYVVLVDWAVTTIADCYGLEPEHPDARDGFALYDKGEDDPPIAEFAFQDDALRVAEILRHVSAGARPASPAHLVLDEGEEMLAKSKEELVERIKGLESELEGLRRWKAEANEVLNEWDKVYEAFGSPGPLGASKAANVLRLLNALEGVSNWKRPE